jgi:hypothetical protein
MKKSIVRELEKVCEIHTIIYSMLKKNYFIDDISYSKKNNSIDFIIRKTNTELNGFEFSISLDKLVNEWKNYFDNKFEFSSEDIKIFNYIYNTMPDDIKSYENYKQMISMCVDI